MAHVPAYNTGGRISRRSILKSSAALGLVAIGGGAALSACGDGASTTTGPTDLTFSLWGSPEETARSAMFVKQFNTAHPVGKITLTQSPVAGYKEKILTQLVGGTAPDIFAATDDFMAKLVDAGAVVELGPLLDGPNSKSPTSAFGADAWGAAKTPDGHFFGVTTDCNPSVMWYNKTVLAQAGITDEPADTFTAGKWTTSYFNGVIDKVVASGNKALVIGSSWFDLYPFLTTSGGKVYDGGKFIANEDAKAIEALQWLVENVKRKAFFHVNNVPAGQGQNSLFMSNSLAFTTEGRWMVPTYSKLETLAADIVHRPTPDGSIGATATYTAFMCINKKAKNVDQAFEFLTAYTSVEGQTFRHSEAGVSVPSIKGAEAVVESSGYPKHAKTFMDAQAKAYPLPVEEARVPGLSGAIQSTFDTLFTELGSAKATLDKIAALANKAIAAGQLD